MLLFNYNTWLLGMFAGEVSKEYLMNQNSRTEVRLPLQNECILYNRFGFIKTQTANLSKFGLGVGTDRTLPFKDGCELTAVIPGVGIFPQAQLMWTKKDINNTTRLGLKFLPA